MIKRPSKYREIVVRISRFLPPKGYFAITLFGKVFIRRHNADFWEKNKNLQQCKVLLHHEWIHARQAVSTHNSWICFYLLYLYYYLKNRPLRYGHRIAYYANPFELEAYVHEKELSYAQNSATGAYGWRDFAAMTLAKRQEMCQNIMRMRG